MSKVAIEAAKDFVAQCVPNKTPDELNDAAMALCQLIEIIFKEMETK